MMIQSDIETAYQDRASSPKETSERDSQSATLYWNMQANLLRHGFLSGVSIDARNFQNQPLGFGAANCCNYP